MALVLLENLFFVTKNIDFPKIRYKDVQHFNLVHAHRPKFGLAFFLLFVPLPVLNFFFFPISVPFT